MTQVRTMFSSGWVLASKVFAPDDRPAEYASLVGQILQYRIITEAGEVIDNPKLGDFDQAKRFSNCPWGSTFIPVSVANAIDNWRRQTGRHSPDLI